MKICPFILWLMMQIIIDTWHLPLYMMHFWLKINITFSQWSYTEMRCHTSNTSIANDKCVCLNWLLFFVISFQNLSFSKVQLWHLMFDSLQRVSQIASVLSYWKLLFGFTHPTTRISRELLRHGTDIRLFSSPFEGYLR